MHSVLSQIHPPIQINPSGKKTTTKKTMALMPNSVPQNGSPRTNGWCNGPNTCSLYTVYGRNTIVTYCILLLHHTLLVDYLYAEVEVWSTGAHEWFFVLKARQPTGKSIKTFQCSIINTVTIRFLNMVAHLPWWHYEGQCQTIIVNTGLF